ncbi:MAG: hypothetical protein J6X17_08020, partial [Lachnospiraceae bacterium]|nr:hypothetical protein [Lachnospiraceae bacterium]
VPAERILLQIDVSEDIENRNEIIADIYEDLKPMHLSEIPLKKYKLEVNNNLSERERNRATKEYLSCTEEDIYSGKYLENLELHYIDISVRDLWKKYAIVAFLADEEPDSEAVISFLADADNRDVLSMFPAYFSSYFKTDEEIETDMEIAQLYGRFILDNYGLDELKTCVAGDHINEWLSSLGAGYSFFDEYAELLDRFEYLEAERCAFAVATDQNIVYYITPPEYEEKDVILLREFLCQNYTGVNSILTYIKDEAPQYWQRAYDKLMSGPSLNVFLDDMMNTGGYYNGADYAIHLGSYYPFLHEFCHHIVQPGGTSHSWSYEGFGTYAQLMKSNVVFSYKGVKETLEDYKKRLDCGEDFSDNNVKEKYRRYIEKYGVPDSDEDFDGVAFQRIAAQIETEEQMAGADIFSVYDAYTSKRIQRKENDELSYDQAIFFVEYLIDNYSLPVFLNYSYENVSFTEAFGTTFDEAITAWREAFLAE